MLRDILNIKKLKKQEQNSSRDEKLNKNLLHRKNKNKNKKQGNKLFHRRYLFIFYGADPPKMS